MLGIDPHPGQRAAHEPEALLARAAVETADLAVLADAQDRRALVGHLVAEQPTRGLPHVRVTGGQDHQIRVQLPSVVEPVAGPRDLALPGALRLRDLAHRHAYRSLDADGA